MVEFDPAQMRQLVLDVVRATGEAKAAEARAGKTFGELAEAWLKRISAVRVYPANEGRHVQLLAPLADLREGQLTKGAIDDLFATLLAPRGPLGPTSVNKVRSTGKLIISDAQGNNLWAGLNPFALVRRMKQSKPMHETMTLAELNLVLAKLSPDRRRLAKTVLLVGLRPGEALGLKKVDVDLEQGFIWVRRSHGRSQTKTGKERKFPIPDALLEDLRQAIAESPSEYVFPKADGARQPQSTRLADRLRTAIGLAGIVTGYRFTCRKYSCEYDGEQFRDKLERVECPGCGKSMHRYSIPKRFRFYDLRHSSATLHRQAKCDPLVVREMMGHGSDNTTDAEYTHLDVGYQRAELNKLKLEEPAEVQREKAGSGVGAPEPQAKSKLSHRNEEE